MSLSVVGTQKVLRIHTGLQKARREWWMVVGKEGPGGEDGR